MADETVVANTAASLEGQTLLINGGQLGTPSSGDLQNCDGLPAATGLTGVVPAAQGGAGTVSGLLKADGLGTVSAAAAGTDYANLTFKTIAVSGQSDVVADSAADTLTLAAGTGVTLATTPGSDTVTISATGTGGTVTANGTLTSGKTIVGDGTTVITASALTATVVKSATGTLSAASAGTDYTDAAFKTIAVSGQSDVVADSAADTLTLAAGTNITITTNASTDTVTITASGGGSGSVTNTGTLTSGKLIQGNGTVDVTANTTTATVVKLTAGTPSAASAGTDYTDAAFKTIAVAGQSDVVADSAADTLTLAAGSGVTLTTNASTDTVTIAASGGGGTPGGSDKDIQYNNSGAFGGISPGSAGTVLTSNGASSTPSFQSAGAGALVLLEQHTASASASLDFTAWYSSTYDDYLIEVINLTPATNATTVKLRFSTNGGSSYDSGNNYLDSSFAWTSGGSGTTGTTVGQDGIFVGSGDAVSNSTTGFGINGTFHIVNPGSTTKYKQFYGQGHAWSSASTVIAFAKGSLYNVSGSAVDAFRMLATTGNLTIGTVRVYGIAK